MSRHTRNGRDAMSAETKLLFDEDFPSVGPERRSKRANGEANRLRPEDRPVHDWYRFVLSYPPHLVREYVGRFGVGADDLVLDPFCGTGTTLVECKKMGLPSAGIEITPVGHFASCVKIDWKPDPDGLLRHAGQVAEKTLVELGSGAPSGNRMIHLTAFEDRYIRTLDEERMSLLLSNSMSPLPLHKTIVLLDNLAEHQDERYHKHELLALAKSAVYLTSNLQFGPEVGVGRPKRDAPVVEAWLRAVREMARDLRGLKGAGASVSRVQRGDSRQIADLLAPQSVDAVITSPPYPNEKDYTRTTRLESVLLGFISDKVQLRDLKRTLVRSNTRGVYKEDDDDRWVAQHPRIQRIAAEIEARRIEMGKTSGFERLYARVTRLYFGGMARHLAELREVLRPGARLAYVVGDQASYLRVNDPDRANPGRHRRLFGLRGGGPRLVQDAARNGDQDQLREEVLVLRWPDHGAAKEGLSA